jgi:hypothetical protein
MRRASVERRLTEAGGRLRALREELRVSDEQLHHLGDEAEDARLRAIVSETPLAEREDRDARRHADAMANRRREVERSILTLEARVDELLDHLPR